MPTAKLRVKTVNFTCQCTKYGVKCPCNHDESGGLSTSEDALTVAVLFAEEPTALLDVLLLLERLLLYIPKLAKWVPHKLY
jgi:hypothetical protein